MTRSTKFDKYVLDNHGIWVDHVNNKLFKAVSQDELLIVFGYVKTDGMWTLAVATRNQKSKQGAAEIELTTAGSASVSITHSLDQGIRVEQRDRSYPAGQNDGQGKTEEQCIFLQRYKVKTRLFMPKKLEAGAGYHQLPDNHDSDAAETALTTDARTNVEYDDSSPVRLATSHVNVFSNPT